ncbi:MAG: exodeoxyribonuclease VII large subunit [Desulfurivibrionaceae bacterium]|nr:exodeoxyribonuclease VII large subunit [Desulfurivibrionaceae bacterium]
MFPSDQPPFPSPSFSRPVQTVSELTSSITLLLENEFPFVAICGEISNLRRPYSGHFYFTLKDSQAQIRCVLFKNQQGYLQKPLAEGAKVICKGRISVYKQRGEYQIIVDHIADEGLGAIQQDFERLKEKLRLEGLFAPELKKELPAFVRKICLITSPSGAAVHDFLKKALERFADLEVEILPAAVQGKSAAQEIIKQIKVANRRGWADVIILTRGGGSLEDLAAFNDEQLARAIHASLLPVVSAIGHEVDFTIADFAADHRSPTPTSAAAEVVFDQNQLLAHLELVRRRLTNSFTNTMQRKKKQLAFSEKLLTDPRKIIDHYRLKVDHAVLNLSHSWIKKNDAARQRWESSRQKLDAQNPERRIAAAQARCDALVGQLNQEMKEKLHKSQESLARQITLLEALSPLAVLKRGYALAMTQDNRIISSVQQVKKGDPFTVRVDDGIIAGVVEKGTRN